MSDLVMVRRALISVSDKTNLADFARALVEEFKVELISTGGTAKYLRDAGLTVIDVSDVTGFPEMMDGRVKTLHPKIHGGLLALRDDPHHAASMQEHDIAAIDLVCVNLYPFEQTIAKPDVTLEDAIENIDIGGPSMVRSAAKNHAYVAVVTDPRQYEKVLGDLRKHGGSTCAKHRAKLAQAAFAKTAQYDYTIAQYLEEAFDVATDAPTTDVDSLSRAANPQAGGDSALKGEATERRVRSSSSPLAGSQGKHDDSKQARQLDAQSLGATPTELPTLRLKQTLRYGENPHQRAALYVEDLPDVYVPPEASVAYARQLHGKELSYINLLDADAALSVVKEFSSPAACVVKHATPCGVATGASLAEAFTSAYAGDPLAAFGGIVAVNQTIDVATARTIVEGQKFLEVIVAPEYDDDALALLRERWKNTRLLAVGPVKPLADLARDADANIHDDITLHKIVGGYLVQERDLTGLNESEWKVVSKRPPTTEELAALRVAWLACKHVKSNAIVIARGGKGPSDDIAGAVVGIGGGQVDRVNAARVAVSKAGEKARGAVAASDAFFPFPDGPELLLNAGVTALIHPGGSVRDNETIALADARGAAVVLTGQRHFRH